MDNKKRFLFYY